MVQQKSSLVQNKLETCQLELIKLKSDMELTNRFYRNIEGKINHIKEKIQEIGTSDEIKDKITMLAGIPAIKEWLELFQNLVGGDEIQEKITTLDGMPAVI